MAEDTDGIEEAFEGQLRVLVSAAGQTAERIVRAREEQQRRAQTASEQQSRELASRLEGEKRAARAELGTVHRSQWWDSAKPEQIAQAHQLARAWAQEDPEAVRAEQRIREEVRTRYGIDVDNTGADPAAVAAAVQRAEQNRVQEDVERQRAAAENAEAHILMKEADRDEQRAEQARAVAEHEPGPHVRTQAHAEVEQDEGAAVQAGGDGRVLYDSAERREASARELEAKGLAPDLVATRMRADVSQADRPTGAVSRASVPSPALPASHRPHVRQAARTGLIR